LKATDLPHGFCGRGSRQSLQSAAVDHDRVRTTVVLCAFAVVFIALTVGSYTQKSATVDEPQHLTAGYTALRLHDHRVDPEHPPFLRLWAAVPLLAMSDVKVETNSLAWQTGDDWEYSHHFLYQLNDADRLLYRARFMTVVLGVILGVLVFCWAQELFGFWTASAVLALYCVEPNILAHSSLVTTDLGVACFIFGAVYFLWRMARVLTFCNIAGLAGFFALAQVSKFSALLLGPIVLVLLLLRVLSGRAWRCQLGGERELRSPRSKTLAALALVLLLALASYAAVWATYSFRYGPMPASNDLARLRDNPQFLEHARHVATVVNWLDEHRLLPDTYAQGLILSQVKVQRRSAYLVGEFSRTGWWYYFPVAFLVKTPLTVLFLLFCGLALLVKQRARWKGVTAFLVLPPAIFLGVALTAHLNIGLRHVLPIYPFAFLITGVTLDEMRAKWRAVVLLAPVALAAIELATVYPHCLAFFNRLVGGPANGHLVLLDSNLDWGQDLKPLKQWMDAHHVEQINLSYFGTADPAYYGIHCTHLLGAPSFDAPLIAAPRLPGYVAVSAQNLHGVRWDEPLRAVYAPLLEREPTAVIGYSIHVYWVETNWWYNPRP
jgi:hypothetical protein